MQAFYKGFMQKAAAGKYTGDSVKVDFFDGDKVFKTSGGNIPSTTVRHGEQPRDAAARAVESQAGHKPNKAKMVNADPKNVNAKHYFIVHKKYTTKKNNKGKWVDR